MSDTHEPPALHSKPVACTWPYDNPRRADIQERTQAVDWYQDTAELLKQFGLAVPSCRGGKCGPGNRCDNCDATIKYLDCLYREREECALDLRRLQRLVKVYPEEMREVLAGIIADVVHEIQEE